MTKIPVFWIIAGTAEGRNLAERLSSCQALVHVSLATEYGKWFVAAKENLLIKSGRLNKEEMAAFINREKIDCVIDATHPYAREVTENTFQACTETGTRYLRLVRPESGGTEFMPARDVRHAAEILAQMPGRIFLTCGSKEIESFTCIPDYQERVYLRVLPMPEVIQKCIDLGFRSPNIIAMQGPFSRELNIAMFKATKAQILVTKDSGAIGGFPEKIEAAQALGLNTVVIGRPAAETGLTFTGLLETLQKDYDLDFDQNPGQNDLYFPLFVSLKGKKVKIFGAGIIAARRIQCLLRFGATLAVIAPKVCPEIVQMKEIEIVPGRYREGDCQGADLVIAATDDSEVNRLIARECSQRHIPVSVADNRELCTFYFPAVVSRDHMVIGITSSGTDHGRVKRAAGKIRRNIEEILE
jgi:precorrin-6A/cobalt-precorrin-6A reductase